MFSSLPCFCTFYRFIPTSNEFLKKTFSLVSVAFWVVIPHAILHVQVNSYDFNGFVMSIYMHNTVLKMKSVAEYVGKCNWMKCGNVVVEARIHLFITIDMSSIIEKLFDM